MDSLGPNELLSQRKHAAGTRRRGSGITKEQCRTKFWQFNLDLKVDKKNTCDSKPVGRLQKLYFEILVGGLETMEFYFSIQLGMSSFQLTFTHIFQRGRSTTSQVYINHKHS